MYLMNQIIDLYIVDKTRVGPVINQDPPRQGIYIALAPGEALTQKPRSTSRKIHVSSGQMVFDLILLVYLQFLSPRSL